MQDKIRNWFKEYGVYILIIVVIILIRSFIITPVRVSGNSMSPTLVDGEIMILNKLSKIEKYDIVVVSKSYLENEFLQL